MKLIISVIFYGFGFLIFSQTRLTQSSNFNIWMNNSQACVTSGPETIEDNSFIRIFDLTEYPVADTAFFIWIETAIDTTSGGAYDITGRVHRISGPILFSEFELLTEKTHPVFPDSSNYFLNIPFDSGYALPADSVVMELFSPYNSSVIFKPGSNPYPETGTSFIAANACGLTEPTPFADVSYPEVKLLMHLWINQKPIMIDVSKNGFKNNTFNFNYSDFVTSYLDYDNDTLELLRIQSLPLNGSIYKSGIPLNLNDTLLAFELDQLEYIPNIDYSGSDNFSFMVRDGYHWSNQIADVNLTIYDWQVGITEINSQTIVAFPNPSSGHFQLSTTWKTGIVTLISADGKRTILVSDSNGRYDVSGFSSGIYLLELINENQRSLIKLIIQS